MNERQPSASERIRDSMATWKFVGLFLLFLVLWMGVNTGLLMAFGVRLDAYPFIFLNLILSCIAAIQAPVIMMSGKISEKRTGRLIQETHDETHEALGQLHTVVRDVHSIVVAMHLDVHEEE